MAPRITVPLFITCRNPACGRVKPVKSRFDQRRYRFCSRRCAGIMTGHAKHMSAEDQRRGAERSKVVRRDQALAKLAGLSPIQIYRQGYEVGWKAGVRRERRRQGWRTTRAA